jgi:hypothetical protein
MYAFSVGFAVFGAVVCVSALVTEHRPLLGADGLFRSRRYETNRLGQFPLLLVATLASVTLDESSRSDGDVDIHGVEAESDLKKSHDASSRKSNGADSAVDR